MSADPERSWLEMKIAKAASALPDIRTDGHGTVNFVQCALGDAILGTKDEVDAI
ncbi:MAG: hypothetical protein WA970_13150 [Gammaproteobacteria bacterium]